MLAFEQWFDFLNEPISRYLLSINKGSGPPGAILRNIELILCLMRSLKSS